MPEKYIKAADCEKYFYEHLDDVHIAAAMNAIDEMPAADVAPVRHGYWCKEKRDVLIHWHCSACKECFYLDKPNAEYCPRCGAKMDGKERDENA